MDADAMDADAVDAGSDVETEVRAYLGEEIMPPDRASALGRSDDLLGRGVLNSLTLTHLVMFLEERYAIRVEPAEFEVDTFRSLESIARFVEAKRGD